MKKVLVVCGHPDLKSSLANKTILDELSGKLSDVEIRKLNELYPDYQIDVKAEQDALVRADVVVFQFPFHWYSVPALLKVYIDKVMEHGWAYGSTGKALAGKKLIVSTTAGGPAEKYAKGGAYGHEVSEFGYFLEGMAKLCSMEALPMVFNCGMMYVPGVSDASQKDAVIAKAKAQAEAIVKLVEA